MSSGAPRTRCRWAAGALRNPSSSATTQAECDERPQQRGEPVRGHPGGPREVRRSSAVRRRAAENRPISSAANSVLDAMKPYAMIGRRRGAVCASICPPLPFRTTVDGLDLHSDCRRRRGIPDPRPARGRRPRVTGPGRRPEAARPARRAAARGRRGGVDRPPRHGGVGRGPAAGRGRRAARLRVAAAGRLLPDRLRWRAPGYALDVADGELDAAEFRRLARARPASARRSATTEPPPTCSTPRSALWRGEALDEFDAVEIDADGQLARLADLRLAAVRGAGGGAARAGSRPGGRRRAGGAGRAPPRPRDAGRPAHARPLRRAVGRPTRWPSTGRLRRRLVDELGVEPSEATRALHRRVLEQDPTLAPERPRPAHQPAAPGHHARRAGPRDRRGRRRAADGPARHAGRRRRRRQVPARGRGGGSRARPVRRRRVALPSWPRSPTAAPSRTPSRPRCGCSSGTARRSSRRSSSTSRPARCCSCWTTASTCWTRRRGSAQSLVAQCPGVVVLATSREPLGVDGRAGVAGAAAAAPGRHRAVRAARAGHPARLRPRSERAGSVAEICRRVDGLPLGIELAAARTRAMSAAEIAAAARRRPPARPRRAHRAAAPPEPRRRDRLVLPAARARRAAAVRADVGVRGRRRSRRRARRVRRARHDRRRVARPGGRARGQVHGRGGAVGQAGTTRYRMLETLRAYARERLAAERRGSAAGTPCTSSAWPRRPPAVCRASTSAPGSRRRCRTWTTSGPRSSSCSPSATSTSPCAWSRRCPS